VWAQLVDTPGLDSAAGWEVDVEDLDEKLERWLPVVHAGSLVAAFVVIVMIGRRQWFGGDEWDFFTRFDLAHHPLDVFRPHNEHLSFIPLLVFKAMFATIKLRSYAPYVAFLAFLHVLTAHLLWRLARRVGADPLVSTALVVVFLFLGAGWFNIIFAFQAGFVGSTALGLATLLVLDVDGPLSPRRVLAVWMLSLGSILFSGLGATFTAIAGLFVLLRRGPRVAAVVVALPAAFYSGWFLVVGRHHVTAFGLVGKTTYLQLPDFAWTGLTTALERATGFTGAGAVLVLALAAYLLRNRLWNDRRGALAVALAGGSVIFFLVAGSGRLVFGPTYAAQSRYIYEGTAILLVPAALALTSATARSVVSRLVIVSVLALVAARGAYELKVEGTQREQVASSEKARILAVGRLLRDAAPVIVPGTTTVQPFDLDVNGVRKLVAEKALPLAEAPGDQDPATFAARLQLEVRFAPSSGQQAPLDAPVLSAVGVNARDVGAGCQQVEAAGSSRIRLAADKPMALSLTSATGGVIQASLESVADPGAVSKAAELSLPARRSMVLSAHAPGTVLVLTLPAGSVAVCGARLPTS
jgi:hypothetical protein